MLKRYKISGKRVVASPKGPIHLFVHPEEGERRLLVLDWGLDPHTLRSALDPSEPARLEMERGHVAFIFKRPRSYSGGTKELGVGSTGVFLFRGRMALLLSEQVPLFEGVECPEGTLPGLALRLLEKAVLQFLGHLGAVERLSDEIQDKLNAAMENRHLITLFGLQKSLTYYLGAVNANTALLELLRHHASQVGFSRRERDFLGDLVVENNQCYRQAEDLAQVLSNLMDARASIVNNNLNIFIKFLNLLTILVMVPTLVVSVFSMNVALPGQGHPWAFWGVLVLALASAGIFLAYWRSRKW